MKNRVIRLTGRLDMTLAVDRDYKPQTEQIDVLSAYRPAFPLGIRYWTMR